MLPKEEMRQAIRNFLYAQLDEEPGLTSCLIIHTINKDHERVRFNNNFGYFSLDNDLQRNCLRLVIEKTSKGIFDRELRSGLSMSFFLLHRHFVNFLSWIRKPESFTWDKKTEKSYLG